MEMHTPLVEQWAAHVMCTVCEAPCLQERWSSLPGQPVVFTFPGHPALATTGAAVVAVHIPLGHSTPGDFLLKSGGESARPFPCTEWPQTGGLLRLGLISQGVV